MKLEKKPHSFRKASKNEIKLEEWTKYDPEALKIPEIDIAWINEDIIRLKCLISSGWHRPHIYM